jgi:hypothetical protein
MEQLVPRHASRGRYQIQDMSPTNHHLLGCFQSDSVRRGLFSSPSSPPTYYLRFSFDSDFRLEGLAVNTNGRRILAFLSAVWELVCLSPGVDARIGRVLPGDLVGVVVCRRCSVVQRVRHFYQRRFFVNFPHPGLRFGLPVTTGSSPSPIHSTTANTTYRALPIPLVLPPLAFATCLPRFRRIRSVIDTPGFTLLVNEE